MLNKDKRKHYFKVKGMRVAEKNWRDFKSFKRRDETDNGFIVRVNKVLDDRQQKLV